MSFFTEEALKIVEKRASSSFFSLQREIDEAMKDMQTSQNAFNFSNNNFTQIIQSHSTSELVMKNPLYIERQLNLKVEELEKHNTYLSERIKEVEEISAQRQAKIRELRVSLKNAESQEKVVMIPVEKIIQIPLIVEKEVIKFVPKQIIVQKIIEVPVTQQRNEEKMKSLDKLSEVEDIDMKNVQCNLSGLLSDRSVDNYQSRFLPYFNNTENFEKFQIPNDRHESSHEDQSSKEQQIQILKSQIFQLTEQIEQFQQELYIYEKELSRKSKENQKLIERNDVLEEEIKTVKQEYEKLKGIVENREKVKSENETMRKQLKLMISQAKGYEEKIHANAEMLQKMRVNEQKMKDEYGEQINHFRMENQSLQNLVASLKSALSEEEKKFQVFAQKSNQLEDEKILTCKKLEQSELQIEQLHQKLSELEDLAKNKY